MVPRPAIPDSADAITATWMQEALAAGGGEGTPAIRDVVIEQVGTGIGLVAETLRCHLSYAHEAPLAPRSVIIKRPTSHRETLKLARRLRLYQRECAYYRLLAHEAPIRAPTLLYEDFDRRTHRFILVLEDLGTPSTRGVPSARLRDFTPTRGTGPTSSRSPRSSTPSIRSTGRLSRSSA